MKRPAAHQRGLSLVELMVGMAVGLFIVATGSALLVGHLHESRRLLTEARLMQDLRTTVDLLARDVRRAGYWGAAAEGVWQRDADTRSNPYTALDAAGAADTSRAIGLRYSRDTAENHHVDSNEVFGFRLRNGAIEMLLGHGNWQSVTDPGVLRITTLALTPQLDETELEGFCTRPCPAAATPGMDCPPRVQVRSLSVQISGHATAQAEVTRHLRSKVRIRNDVVIGSCPP